MIENEIKLIKKKSLISDCLIVALKIIILLKVSLFFIVFSNNKCIEFLEVTNLLNVQLVIMSLYIALFVFIASNFSNLNSERFKDIELSFKLMNLTYMKIELYVNILCIGLVILLGFFPESITYKFDESHILNITNVLLCFCLLYPVLSLVYLSEKTFRELNNALTKEINKIQENER